MRILNLTSDQKRGCIDGEFKPYPRDLTTLTLGTDIPNDIRVEIRTGKRPCDMIFAAFNVVSQHFVDVLRQCDATGYQACPIPVRKKEQEFPGYYLLKIKGRGGPVDVERSNLQTYEGGHGVKSYDGIYMHEDQWDGSDVFAIPGLGISMYVVERVANALKEAKLCNVKLKEASKCHWP